MGAVIAVDHGEKKTGFAVVDALRIAATPLDQVAHGGLSDGLFAHLDALVAERDVDVFLVGMPFHMDGTPGGRAREVEAFIARLRARFDDIEVVPWDERLTTKEAESLLREAGFDSRRAKERRDSWSALVLLRDWLASGEPRPG